MEPEKKRLWKEEKLALSRRLAGSAKLFSPESVEEAIRIANREYDQEEEAYSKRCLAKFEKYISYRMVQGSGPKGDRPFSELAIMLNPINSRG
ncbi:hypothetical protein [Bacillus songklensis]|uniref:hypothetical protein n=1 Tax=Bacillus songklensis TaxID=1069116 RepID=UPI00366B1314